MPIALITDFGSQDSYVGVMKGVIARICPDTTTIDLSHDLPPQDIYAGRFTLHCTYPYLPGGTVYLVVVDPGVGTQRRAIALQTRRGYLVGPDNGVLGGVLATDELLGVVELTNRAYWRVPEPSATFHGRDIFAPVAAHLANGVPLMNLGPAVAVDTLVQLTETEAIATATGWQGMVQYIDRFGNAATTIPAEAVAPGPWTLTVGGTRLPGAHTYDAVPPGGGLALVGSHGFVEIAINQGSAATRFRLGVGDRVSLTLGIEGAIWA
jgi:S-adenosyl-L-methionine hydrolase (adenosine-forming)